MKKLLLTVSVLITICQSVSAQIPNSGFECWNQYPGPPFYEEPCGWTSYNAFSGQGYPVFVFKTNDHHNGDYAIEVRTQGYNNPFPPGNPLVDVGYAQTGTNYQNGPNGFPYTQRPQFFSAWVKYLPSGVDSAEVKIKLYKWNAAQQQQENLGQAVFYVSTTDSVYHCKMANFTYNSPWTTSGNPDSASVLIQSSFQNNPTAGSIIKVDDVAFGNCTVGITDVPAEQPLHFYPNPATEMIYFSWLPAGADRIKIFEITGQKVATEAVSGEYARIDVKSLKPGIYFYAVYDDNNKVTNSGKFSIIR